MTRSARRLLGLSGWAAAFALCLARYITAVRSSGPGRFPDIYVYRGAIKAMMADGSLYAYAAKNGDPFTYPPAAAWMLAPIAWIPTAALEPLWFTLELLTVAWLPRSSSPKAADGPPSSPWRPSVRSRR